MNNTMGHLDDLKEHTKKLIDDIESETDNGRC